MIKPSSHRIIETVLIKTNFNFYKNFQPKSLFLQLSQTIKLQKFKRMFPLKFNATIYFDIISDTIVYNIEVRVGIVLHIIIIKSCTGIVR